MEIINLMCLNRLSILFSLLLLFASCANISKYNGDIFCSCNQKSIKQEFVFDFHIDTLNINVSNYCAIGKDRIYI